MHVESNYPEFLMEKSFLVEYETSSPSFIVKKFTIPLFKIQLNSREGEISTLIDQVQVEGIN